MNPHARRRARRLALQALYQWKLAGSNLIEIEIQLLEENNSNKIDVEYFRELLHQIPAQISKIDEQINVFLDRSLKEIDPVELSLLRIGCYELMCCPDVPYRVVINEALELAKKFGSVEGYKYINGVLHKIAHLLRAEEINETK